MTPERLKEIEYHLPGSFGFNPECFLGKAILELITFAHSTLNPCPHSEIYRISYAADQMITGCQKCDSILKIEQRKDDKWGVVWTLGASIAPQATPIPQPNCPRCGQPCERCSK